MFDNSLTNPYTLTGGGIGGGGSLTKNGTGTATISNTLSHSGGIAVNAGILSLGTVNSNTFTGGTSIYGVNLVGGINLQNTTFGLGGYAMAYGVYGALLIASIPFYWLMIRDARFPGNDKLGPVGFASQIATFMAALFASMAGINLTHVPYKGSAPAVAALMAGEIDVLFDNIPNIIGQIKAGTVAPIAVTGLKPSSLLPGVPTVAESGAPGFEVNVWFGLQMPAGTPKAIVDQVNRQLAAIYREPDITKRFNDAGVEVVASTPEEFSALLKSEVAKWGKVVQDANVKIE